MDFTQKALELQTTLAGLANPLVGKGGEGAGEVHVAFAANGTYVPYFAAALQSLAEHTNPALSYRIYVLCRGIQSYDQDTLKRQVADFPQVQLTFVDMEPVADLLAKLHTTQQFSVETYYRLLIKDLFPNLDKILYLDSDLIVLEDVATIYGEDVSGFPFAASIDAGANAMMSNPDSTWGDYVSQTLCLKRPETYFNAGVMVMNLAYLRQSPEAGQLVFEGEETPYRYLDQDILNRFADGFYKRLDMRHNMMIDSLHERLVAVCRYAQDDVRQEYLAAREHPGIIHFAGPDKPWDYIGVEFFDYFWKYARKTAYQEVGLRQGLERWIATVEARHEDAVPKLWQGIDAIWMEMGAHRDRLEFLEHRCSELERRVFELELKSRTVAEKVGSRVARLKK